MEFKDVTRIVEGKLYAYGIIKREYPDARISSAYHAIVRDQLAPDSDQERWIVRYHRDILDAAIIERVVKRLPESERKLINLRYVERWPWREVAEKLHVGERTVFAMRDRILMVFAHEFGLTRPDDMARKKVCSNCQ